MKNALLSWAVIWSITVTVPTECPDYKPDPYTGKWPMTRCSVYHSETIDRNMQKEFEVKEEAEEFIKNAPENIRKAMLLKELR